MIRNHSYCGVNPAHRTEVYVQKFKDLIVKHGLEEEIFFGIYPHYNGTQYFGYNYSTSGESFMLIFVDDVEEVEYKLGSAYDRFVSDAFKLMAENIAENYSQVGADAFMEDLMDPEDGWFDTAE